MLSASTKPCTKLDTILNPCLNTLTPSLFWMGKRTSVFLSSRQNYMKYLLSLICRFGFVKLKSACKI